MRKKGKEKIHQFLKQHMGEKMHSSSSSCNCIEESSQACFHGCCTKPSCISLTNGSPKSTTATSSTSITNIALSSHYNFIVATLSSLHPNTTHFTNHESLPPLNKSYSYFIKSFPQFSHTQMADLIRSRDYYHLSLSNHVCLDYVGQGLFSNNDSTHDLFDMRYKAASLKSQLLLQGSNDQEIVSEFELKIRKRIMDYMNVSEEDYTMLFTSNQSSAFKIIADSYPFRSHQNLLTVYDHESEALEVMTEGSKRRGARISSAEFSWPSMRIQSRKLRKKMIASSKTTPSTRPTRKGLFVFPLQSRMSGSRYSYQWMSVARENGWHVLLDACALGPKDMETLGLSLFKPDFIACSFYKVFGQNPSGFSCLFIKKSISSILLTDSNSIGISTLVKSTLEESPPNEGRSIECKGLDHADSLGLIMISARSRFLINWLVNALTRLQHPDSENGKPLIKVYGPNIGFDRGPTLCFNVFDWKGEKIYPILVQKLADRNNISLSYGFLRNVSFVDKSEEDKEIRVETSNEVDEGKIMLNRERQKNEICAITATLGLVTNFEDIYRLWAFVARFLDADFVEKERWRYVALNQTTVEM